MPLTCGSVPSNTSQLATAANLVRSTYFLRSLKGVKDCLSLGFQGKRVFSVGPDQTFTKVEYCQNKINGIWNGPPPRTTTLRVSPIKDAGTQTRVYCYEFDDQGGPLGKPVLYGMDEPKTCKRYVQHRDGLGRMLRLEEEVNIYVIRKKDFFRVLVTDQNKEDLAKRYEEFVQLTDTDLIERLAGSTQRTAELEAVVNLAFFSYMEPNKGQVANTISPDLAAPIDITWSYGKKISCPSSAKYLEVLDKDLFHNQVTAVVEMRNQLEDEGQISSCVRFLQACEDEDDRSPLKRPLLYLIEDNAKAKQFTESSSPQIKELAHKINFYVIEKSSWIPILITEDNKEKLVKNWENYIRSDITQEDTNHLAVWFNTYPMKT